MVNVTNTTQVEQVNNNFLSPLIESLSPHIPFTGYPSLDIFIITLVICLFTTLINKYMTDQVKIKALRLEMKQLNKKMRETIKEDPEKAQEIQREIMKRNMNNFKESFKPKILLITLIPLLVVFYFIKELYGPFGEFFPLIFTEFGWLGTYMIFSIINSLLIKKILDVA